MVVVVEDEGVRVSNKEGAFVEESKEADGARDAGGGGGSGARVELARAKKRSAWKRAERVRPLSRKDRMSVA